MENIILTIPAYDPEGRRIPDGAVHYWNNTTPASVENEKLKLQLKSFEQYRAEVAAKKLADKMLVDNLIMQLAEAKAATLPVSSDIVEVKKMVATVNTIQCEVSNIHRIFNKVADEKPAKKLTPKQKRELALKEALEAEKAEIVLRINQK